MTTRTTRVFAAEVGGPNEGAERPLYIGGSDEPTVEPVIPDLSRLYAFVVVAEELHFRRAAGRLMMAQSPLSRLIRRLELDIGATLLVRNRRSVQLTPAGKVFLDDVRELLRSSDRAISRARHVHNDG